MRKVPSISGYVGLGLVLELVLGLVLGLGPLDHVVMQSIPHRIGIKAILLPYHWLIHLTSTILMTNFRPYAVVAEYTWCSL
jgi:hypothetical protein